MNILACSKPRMKMTILALAGVAVLGTLGGCATPVGPVEVTRFHDAAMLARLGQGTITVEAADGQDDGSLELATYRMAVARELARIGYVEQANGAQVAQLRVERFAFQPGRRGGPVSVGVGGGTGSYRSGVGMGLGINLSGPPAEQVTTRLHVSIHDRAGGPNLWEGRAEFTVRASAPAAQAQLGAPRLAEALFNDFPGNSGETIVVK